MKYINYLEQANDLALGLGFNLNLNESTPVTGKQSQNYRSLCNDELLHSLINKFGLGYWSNSCMAFSSHVFEYLQKKGIPCNLVYGEVIINGTYEFDTTVDGLISEFNKGYSNSSMKIHVWIAVGKDYIIDPTIAARVSEYYDKGLSPHQIISGKASSLHKKMRLEYIPMLSGPEFIERVCNLKLNYTSAKEFV
ncbi:hypothetical protein [Vibrio europaeus]|uniref:hypothetical protein n=1 Tax=Vibrio europaeus TaxID=300876 RepID=UPI00233E8108|nr:hypothetical protein [Vibrio europaeus]MDC5857421.1 hypothetical protein [Vibrio europaeus]